MNLQKHLLMKKIQLFRISQLQKDSSNFDEYILGPGDKIYIEFLNIKELSGIFEIGPTGHIYLPRIRDFLQMVLALRN